MTADRYTMAHIWACPPSEGDDYIFHCHPVDMKIPKPKRLQDWYKKMLDKAIIERVVLDYKVRTVTSDILVLKLVSVLVFILFSSQNFYLVLVFWINDNSSFYIVFWCDFCFYFI